MAGMPTHAGLTADVFVVRGDEFLTLKRGPGRGEGVYYLPGGIVGPLEDPRDAAVRETMEECGLAVRDASILRVWAYPTPEGHETIHATFVGWSDGGDIVLSHEHTAYRWTSPDEYVERWCSVEAEQAVPEHAVWFRQVRTNVDLVRGFIAAGPPPGP